MKDHELRPAMRPEISIGEYEEGKDLEYSIAVEVMPEIAPMTSSTLKLERYKVPADEEQVNDALERMAGESKATEPVDEVREAKSGDVAVIDFVGRVDGDPSSRAASATDTLSNLGSGSFVPGFEDQAKAGWGKGGECNSFPENYPKAELAGKEAVFEVTVKELRRGSPSRLMMRSPKRWDSKTWMN